MWLLDGLSVSLVVFVVSAQKKSIITPSGVVPVVQGSNLTLTCSNESPEASTFCQWSSKIGSANYALKVWINPIGCSRTFGDVTLYGIECFGNNVYRLIIYNVQTTYNGLKWTCNQLIEDVATDSEHIQLDVQESITNVTLSPQTNPVSIIEGTYWQFFCLTSSGSPAATVTWYKTGGLLGTIVQPITVNITDVPSEQGSRSTLRFFPNRNDDNVRIYCTARNIGPVFNSSLKPTIIVLYGPSEPVCIYKGNSVKGSISIIESKTVSINCSSSSVPSTSWHQWRYPGGLQSTQQLNIPSIQRSQNGSFEYEVQNIMTPSNASSNTTGSSVFTLAVNVLYTPSTPTFKVGKSRVSGTVRIINGNSITIRCSSDSNPPSIYTWTYSVGSTSGSDLILNNVQYPSSNGQYACLAKNVMRPTSEAEKTGDSIENITVEVLYGPQVAEMDNKSIVRGDSLSFECPFTEGNPSFTSFIWMQNKTGSIKSRIQALSIPNVQRNDNGTYTCEATNEMRPTGSQTGQAGRSTGKFHLDVLFGAENLKFKMNDDSSTTIELSEKSNVSIVCSVESNPASNMTISKDGVDVVSENGVTSLKFSRYARCEDAGVYVCTGNNSYPGRPSSSITLHVTCSARRLPDFDIEQNVSSAIGSVAVLEFRAEAYPLPTKITWERCTPICTKIEHGGKFNISSNNEIHFFLTIENVTEEDYGKYNFTIANGIGEPWQEVFYLIPYGKPQTPTNFRYIPESVTTSSVTLSWNPGFNGGPDQTFVVLYKIERGTTWNMLSINQTSQVEMNVTIYNLSPETSYDTVIFAENKIGNSSRSTVLTFVTLEGIINPPTSYAALIGGLAGGGTFVVLLAIGALVIYKRKLGAHKPQSTQLTTHHHLEVLEEDSDPEDVVENMMYESAGVIPKIRQSADNLYASPIKNKNTRETGDVYAVVNKKHKKEKRKDKKEKSKNDIYENSETAKPSYVNKGFDSDSKQNKLHQRVNDDGLLYADLVFANPPKGQKKLIIHGLDDMTEYAEVDLTKKADPLPDNDDETIKADK